LQAEPLAQSVVVAQTVLQSTLLAQPKSPGQASAELLEHLPEPLQLYWVKRPAMQELVPHGVPAAGYEHAPLWSQSVARQPTPSPIEQPAAQQWPVPPPKLPPQISDAHAESDVQGAPAPRPTSPPLVSPAVAAIVRGLQAAAARLETAAITHAFAMRTAPASRPKKPPVYRRLRVVGGEGKSCRVSVAKASVPSVAPASVPR